MKFKREEKVTMTAQEATVLLLTSGLSTPTERTSEIENWSEDEERLFDESWGELCALLKRNGVKVDR